MHFYYADLANAQIHMSDVQFSPITFDLCRYLNTTAAFTMRDDVDEALAHVTSHEGKYKLDRGRIDE